MAQSVGTEYVGPFTFNMSRSVLAGLFLIPVIAVMQRINPEHEKSERTESRKTLVAGGVLCGIALFVASNLQQIGIEYTTVGKAGFITAMYIILVPIFSIFLHKKAGIKLWISVVIAVAGLYLLCMNGSFSIAKGDLIVFLCAIAFSFSFFSLWCRRLWCGRHQRNGRFPTGRSPVITKTSAWRVIRAIITDW